jgi:DNA-binding CsgD family transcriptional regulator
LVIDDLHWADRSSALLLTHVGRDLPGSRILVVAAYRDLEITRDSPAASALAALNRERGIVQVQLTGLAEVEVADQLEAIHGRSFDIDLIAAVARRSRGNPFFVAEIGRLLDQAARAGQIESSHWEQAVPVGARALITRRLDRLGLGARDFLRTAAVAGAAIDAATVAAACASTPEQVLDQLDAAADAGLISTGRGATEFSHALVRDTLIAEVPPSRRVRIHGRIAEHIEATFRGELDRHSASLAQHWLSALPAADARRAVSWAERAAANAMAALAYEEAARLYGRGLAAMGYGRFDSQDRCRLLTGQAEAAFKSGDVNSAIASASAAVSEARQSGDPLTMTAVAVCLEGVTDTAWARTVVRFSKEALGRLGDDELEARARLVATLASQCSILEGPGRAGPLSEHAMELAEQAGTPAAQISALRARQMARADPDGVHDRLDAAQRMLVLAGQIDDPWAEVWGRLWRIDAQCQLGELGAAEADLAGLGDATGLLRQPVADWHLARTSCAIALGRGRFADAGHHLEQMARAGRGLDVRGRQMQAGAGSKLAALTGDCRYEPFVAMLEARGDAIQASGMMADINLALLYAARGDMARAESHYQKLGPWQSFQVPHFVALAACNERARAAALLGDVEGAAIAYDRLRPWARFFAVGGSGVVSLAGSAELALGCLAASMGKTDTAVRHMRAAIGANHRAGMPPFEAEARYELAKVLASRPGRNSSEALVLAADAADAAARLGMEPLRAKARHLVDSLRQPAGDSRPAGLTRREQEIAGLVARGLTNRQIAEVLHIAERTAENHVQHILAKLSFQTRSQIAAWVTAEGINPGMANP